MLERYSLIIAVLHILVDFLLLTAVCKWEDQPGALGRMIVAALLGGAYAGACLLPGFHFLGNGIWRLLCLVVVSLTAFGVDVTSLRKGMIFLVLWLAIHEMASGFERENPWTILLWAALLVLLYLVGFDRGNGSVYVPVCISHQGKTVHITALHDTGNLLQDPLTGQNVLVVDPSVAEQLLGLKKEQLADPIGTMTTAAISGLRLIPYSSLGESGGMLLAMRFSEVEIGNERASRVVAFSPNDIGKGRGFRALAGGMA